MKTSRMQFLMNPATDKENNMGYLERIDAYKDEMLEALAESVSKPSVKADPVKTKDGELLPFGQGVHEALISMLEKGKELGFDTYNDDNYAGHIEWKSENGGDEYFGIVGHLDVVPVDSGWATDPFEMVDKGDCFVYGRGTSDDKGPVGLFRRGGILAIRQQGNLSRWQVFILCAHQRVQYLLSAQSRFPPFH